MRFVHPIFFFNRRWQTSNVAPFIYTPEGIRFKDAISLQGKTRRTFVWNKADMTFTCSDEGATDVVLKAFILRIIHLMKTIWVSIICFIKNMTNITKQKIKLILNRDIRLLSCGKSGR